MNGGDDHSNENDQCNNLTNKPFALRVVLVTLTLILVPSETHPYIFRSKVITIVALTLKMSPVL